MRTKGQQDVNSQAGANAMMTQIKSTFLQSRETLLQDAAGVVALAIMLVVGLHFPVLI